MATKITDTVLKTTPLNDNDVFVIRDSATNDIGIVSAKAIRGISVFSGTTDPVPSTNYIVGDFYINTINLKIFGPYTGSWGVGIELKGVDGTGLSIPTYNSLATYNTNESVVYNKVLYRSIIDNNTNNQPDASLSSWETVLSMANTTTIQPYNPTTIYLRGSRIFQYNRFLKAIDGGITGPFDITKWQDEDGRGFQSINHNALYVIAGDTITFDTFYSAGSTMTYSGTCTAVLNGNLNGITITSNGTLGNIAIKNASGTVVGLYPCQEGAGNGTELDTAPSVCYNILGDNHMNVLYKNRKNYGFGFNSTEVRSSQMHNISAIGAVIYNGYIFVPDANLHIITIYRASDQKLIRTLGVEGDFGFSKTILKFYNPRGLHIDPVLKRLYIGCYASVVVCGVPDNIETDVFPYVTHLMMNYATATTWTVTGSGGGFASYCYGIATSLNGQDVYCLDYSNHTIKKWITTNGNTYTYSGITYGSDSTTASTYINSPVAIKLYNNRLYFVNPGISYGLVIFDLSSSSFSTPYTAGGLNALDIVYDTVAQKAYLYSAFSSTSSSIYRYEISQTTGAISNQTILLASTTTTYVNPIEFKTMVKNPTRIAVSQDYMLVTLSSGGSILFNRTALTFSAFIGGGAGLGINLGNTYAMGIFDNKIFLGNNGNHSVAVFDISSGFPVHKDFLGSNLNSTGDSAGLALPRGRICYSPLHNIIVVCSASNNSVMFFRNMTNYPALAKMNASHTSGIGNYVFYNPVSCWLDNEQNYLYITDYSNHRVMIYDMNTIASNLTTNTFIGNISVGFVGQVGISNASGSTNDKFTYPTDICTDSSYLYVIDAHSNARIQVFNKYIRNGSNNLAFVRSLTNSTELTSYSTDNYKSITITNDYIIIADTYTSCIKFFSKNNFSTATVQFLGGKNDTTNAQYDRGLGVINTPYVNIQYGNYLYVLGYGRVLEYILGGFARMETKASNWNLSQGFKINANNYLIPSKAGANTPADNVGTITNPAVFGKNNCDGDILTNPAMIGYFSNESLPLKNIVLSANQIATGDLAYDVTNLTFVRALVNGNDISWIKTN
jgi:hypothetical protein